MFFIQVVRGRPGGRLQFSGGGSKMHSVENKWSGISTKNRIARGQIFQWEILMSHQTASEAG